MLVLKKRFSIRTRLFLSGCFICTLLCIVHPAVAQLPIDTAKNQAIDAPAWPEDSLGRRTPRGTVEGFISAVAGENYQSGRPLSTH